MHVSIATIQVGQRLTAALQSITYYISSSEDDFVQFQCKNKNKNAINYVVHFRCNE